MATYTEVGLVLIFKSRLSSFLKISNLAVATLIETYAFGL